MYCSIQCVFFSDSRTRVCAQQSWRDRRARHSGAGARLRGGHRDRAAGAVGGRGARARRAQGRAAREALRIQAWRAARGGEGVAGARTRPQLA